MSHSTKWLHNFLTHENVGRLHTLHRPSEILDTTLLTEVFWDSENQFETFEFSYDQY